MCACWFQWFDEKIQDVENEEQQLRKLHVMVESLVNHRKGQKCKQSISYFKCGDFFFLNAVHSDLGIATHSCNVTHIVRRWNVCFRVVWEHSCVCEERGDVGQLGG